MWVSSRFLQYGTAAGQPGAGAFNDPAMTPQALVDVGAPRVMRVWMPRARRPSYNATVASGTAEGFF